ncbi:MAG: DUF4142 domain-containing protein [Burkholderiales bacterium]|nr:DUF4142 domain-containing protein [Burkholderiales bacterium]
MTDIRQTKVTRASALAVALALCMGTNTGYAADPAQTAEPAKPAAARPQPPLVGVDTAGRKFLTDAAMGGMTEVEAGELAARKAAQNDVKAFAERMMADHGKANEELKRIAAAKGVELPQQLDREHRSDLDRLEKLRRPFAKRQGTLGIRT